MKKQIFQGICTALVTPFLDGKVNYPMLEQLLARQIRAKIPAVVLSGTTGEAPTLSDSEKLKIFAIAKQYAGNQCLVIAGTGSNNTAHAVELSQAAEQAGADALLVVTPYYNKGNPEGLEQHFKSIAQCVNIPIILYNVPSRTGLDMPVSLYQKLAEVPNICGIKEASTDITKITKIRVACGNSLSVFTGNDEQIVPVISLGGLGGISVISNLFPEETQAMAEAALAGDFDTAAYLQCYLQPYAQALFSEVNPIPVKYAMKALGFDCGDCRLPLGRLNENNKKSIDALFA